MESNTIESNVKSVTIDDLIENIESDNMAKMISFEDFDKEAPEVAMWIDCLSRDRIQFFKSNTGEFLFFMFFTNDNGYRIVVRNDNSYKSNYLGASVMNRKTRTGETWLRGNDLSDGPYSEHTFNKILKSIVKFEMQELDVCLPYKLEGKLYESETREGG